MRMRIKRELRAERMIGASAHGVAAARPTI
jgi:hypothetical protein